MPTKIIYHTIDKSSWGPGPWASEPDKIQWTDEETGLPCLIKRVEHSGHLCGYVGVGPTHPFHGKGGYDEEVNFSVHGGITFNDSCQDMSPEAWQRFKDLFEKAKPEALKHPRGDSANLRRKWASVIEDYDLWAGKAQTEFICHIPEPGTSDNIWWFGFDCAHYGDRSPFREVLFPSPSPDRGVYRNLAYVEENIRDLAKQLKLLEAK